MEKEIVQTIRLANRAEQLPIFALGVGFDANMDLLKSITDRTPGKLGTVFADLTLYCGQCMTILSMGKLITQLKKIFIKIWDSYWYLANESGQMTSYDSICRRI